MASQSKKRVLVVSSRHGCFDPRVYYKWFQSLDAYVGRVTYAFRDVSYKSTDEGYFNFAGKGYFLYLVALYRLVKEKGIRLVIVHDWDILPVFFLLRLRGVKFIFDAHEDYHSQYFYRLRTKTSSLIYGVAFLTLYPFLMLFASAITCPSNHILRRYPNKRRYFISNSLGFRNYRKLVGTTSIGRYFVYVGGLSEDRGASNLLKLSKILVEKGYTLKIAGQLRDQFTRELVSSNYGIEYLGMLSFKESLKLVANSAGGVIPFNNVGQLYIATALKLFEYSAFGKGVLIPDFGEWKEIQWPNTYNVNYDSLIHLESCVENIIQQGTYQVKEVGEDEFDLLNKEFLTI